MSETASNSHGNFLWAVSGLFYGIGFLLVELSVFYVSGWKRWASSWDLIAWLIYYFPLAWIMLVFLVVGWRAKTVRLSDAAGWGAASASGWIAGWIVFECVTARGNGLILRSQKSGVLIVMGIYALTIFCASIAWTVVNGARKFWSWRRS